MSGNAAATQPTSTTETGNKAPGTSNITEDTKSTLYNNMEQGDRKKDDFLLRRGKKPTKEFVLKKLQDESGTFKDCKTYEDAMRILKEGKDPAKNNEEGKYTDLHYRLGKNVVSAESIQEESTYNRGLIYGDPPGSPPTEASVYAKLQSLEPGVYGKAKNFKEAVEILKTRRTPVYERIMENIGKPSHRMQNATDAEQDKELKEQGFTKTGKIPEAWPAKPEVAATKPAEKKAEGTSSRWTAEDEAKRPGSKKTVEPEPTEAKEETKEKKKGGGFFKKMFTPIRHPWKTVRTLAKTARTPFGLTYYMLSDIGIKEKAKRSGWKDRRAGYGKIWEEKK